jgi:hypothetical protein
LFHLFVISTLIGVSVFANSSAMAKCFSNFFLRSILGDFENLVETFVINWSSTSSWAATPSTTHTTMHVSKVLKGITTKEHGNRMTYYALGLQLNYFLKHSFSLLVVLVVS